jgi:hypothetical protein
VQSRNATHFTTQNLHPDTIAGCQQAPNCEVYNTAYGERIRFKAGMEPGTEKYKREFYDENGVAKRDTITTQVSTGANSLNFGEVGASSYYHKKYLPFIIHS